MEIEIVVAVLSLLATIASIVPIYIGYMRNNPKRLLLIAVQLHPLENDRWRLDLTLRNQGKADIPSDSFDAGRPIEVHLGREAQGLEWAGSGSRSDNWSLTGRPSVTFSPGLLKRNADVPASVTVTGRPEVRVEAPLRDTPVKELIGLGSAPAVLQSPSPATTRPLPPAAVAPSVPSTPAPADAESTTEAKPDYPPPTAAPYGSPSVGIPAPPPLPRPMDDQEEGHVVLPPLRGQRRREPVLRGGFGIWAALGCGVIGFVPTIWGSLASFDPRLSYSLVTVGVLLGSAGFFGLLGTLVIRLLRRSLEPPASWRTPAERLRRPGTLAVFAITYIGLVFLGAGFATQGPDSTTTHWATAVGISLLFFAIPVSGSIGLVRLIRALAQRPRTSTGYPHLPA